MGDLLNQLRLLIESVILALGYPGIVLIMALENIFPPIPSELVMPFAGFLVGCQSANLATGCPANEFTMVGVVLAGMAGSVIGALVLYYIGLWADERIVRAFIRRYGRYMLISEADLNTALAYFSRHGEAVIFFGRLIPLVRSLISIPAGMQRMPLGKFLLYTSLGTALWSAILAYAGLFLGRNWETVVEVISQYQKVTLALIGLAVLAFIYVRVIKPRLQSPAARPNAVED
jgi:membrane protein DedA with SNARE-associated domain